MFGFSGADDVETLTRNRDYMAVRERFVPREHLGKPSAHLPMPNRSTGTQISSFTCAWLSSATNTTPPMELPISAGRRNASA